MRTLPRGRAMRMSWCVSLNGKCVEGVQAIPQGRELFVLLHIPGPPPPSPYCTAAQQEYCAVVAEVKKQEALEAEISKVVSRAPALQRSMEAVLEEAALKNSLLEEKLKQ